MQPSMAESDGSAADKRLEEDKTQAEIAKLRAETAKINAESAVIPAQARGAAWSESLKILGAAVLGVGGVFTAVGGIFAAKSQIEAAKIEVKAAETQTELAKVKAERAAEKLATVEAAASAAVMAASSATRTRDQAYADRDKALADRDKAVAEEKEAKRSTLEVRTALYERAAAARAANPNATKDRLVYIQFSGAISRQLVDALRAHLKPLGFGAPGAERLGGTYSAMVKYFRSTDKDDAKRLQDATEKFFAAKGCPLHLALNPASASASSPPLELWLPHSCVQ